MNTDAGLIREKLDLFVPDGYRDEDGIWHEGPHAIEAHEALDRLASALAAATAELRSIQAVAVMGQSRHSDQLATLAEIEQRARAALASRVPQPDEEKKK